MSFAFLAALALFAAPQDWVRAAVTENGVVIYVDHDALQRSGGVVTAWERRDYSPVKETKYQEMRVESDYDCVARTVQVKSAVVTMRGGAPETMRWTPQESPPEPVKPGTISETLLEHICGAAR